MSFVHSKQIGACSCTGWRGFNGISWGAMWDKYFRLPEEQKHGLNRLAYCTAWEFGYFFPTLAGGGWQGGGYELMVGLECNSDNPNQHDGHRYYHMASPIIQRMVDRWGMGVVHLSPWSPGGGDTGSQIRTVTWLMPTWKELEARLDVVKRMADQGDGEAKVFLEGYDMKISDRSKW